MFFRRLFTKRERWLDDQRTDYRQFQAPAENPEDALLSEYERLIAMVVRRWGIPESCASVEVVQLGESVNGRQVFVGLVRIYAWERRPALRLLLGLPLLERKIRKIVRAHWVAEVSHFGGVWLHASERLAESGADADLRHLLASLTQPRTSGLSEHRGSVSRPIGLR